jgi:thioredoxin reductase (NADPH)
VGATLQLRKLCTLTNHASKVTLIHRRDELRAEKILQQRLLEHPKVEVIWEYSAGGGGIGDSSPMSVTAARVKNVNSGEVTDISVEGVFIAIGHKPNTQIFADYSETGR